MKMHAGDEQYSDDVTVEPVSPANPPVTRRGVVATVADWHDKAAVSEEVLVGYTDQSNAYVIDDYPYGRLRCKKHLWKERIEKGAHKGRYQIKYRTTNPKGRDKFNAVAVEHTGSPAQVMVRIVGNDTKRLGHIEARDIQSCYTAADSERFLDRYGLALDEAERTFVTQQIGSQQATEQRKRERNETGKTGNLTAKKVL